jgi:UPF0042 nucleotide-binding protein
VSLRFRDSVLGLIEELNPYFSKEGKDRLNLAFGCTGGRHRSVTMAIVFNDALTEKGYRTTLTHRDL